MKIELKCKCGATLMLEDDRGAYVTPGGKPDDKGRRFCIEIQADEWQDRHQVCLGLPRSIKSKLKPRSTFETFDLGHV